MTEIKAGIFHIPGVGSNNASAFKKQLQDIERLTIYAEKLNFNGAWFAEHHFQDHGGILSSPSLIMAAISQKTKKIRLGFGILQLPYHYPISVAENIATLDLISNGRVDLGIGRGFLKTEYDGFGIKMDESRERFLENYHIIKKIFLENNASFNGKFNNFINVNLYPLPIQKPYPPIWVAAALSAETYEWAGKEGCNLMIAPLLSSSLEELSKMIKLYDAAWKNSNNILTKGQILITIHTHIADTDNEAFDQAKEHLLAYVNRVKNSGSSAIQEFKEKGIPKSFEKYPALGKRWGTFSFEEELNSIGLLIGSKETCKKKIQALIKDFNCTYFLGVFDFGQKQTQIQKSMKLFKEIINEINSNE